MEVGYINKSMITLLDYKITQSYLAYLGFEKDSSKALKIIKKQKPNQRDVFLAFVFGACGSGKVILF